MHEGKFMELVPPTPPKMKKLVMGRRSRIMCVSVAVCKNETVFLLLSKYVRREEGRERCINGSTSIQSNQINQSWMMLPLRHLSNPGNHLHNGQWLTDSSQTAQRIVRAWAGGRVGVH